MADQTTSWALKLDDQTSGAAENAAQALQGLSSEITAGNKELAAMKRALKALESATQPNVEQVGKLKQSIQTQTQAVAQANSAYIALGGNLQMIGKRSSVKPPKAPPKPPVPETGAFAKQLAEVGKRMSEVPIVKFTAQLQDVKGLVAKGGPILAGIIAMGAALGIMTKKVAEASKALFDYAIAQADAARSELLHLEGLTKMRFFYAGAKGNAQEMQNEIDRVAAKVPLARSEVLKLGEQLYKMGARGKNWSTALEATAIKAAVHGSEAASAFAGMAAGAALTGRSVEAMADKVKSRLGGTAQKMMSSLTVQTMKQKEAQEALFLGVDITRYLDAWKGVRDLMSQATASGRALKLIMTTLLQPFINGAATAGDAVKVMFQKAIIWSLRFMIWVVALRNRLRDMFPVDTETMGRRLKVVLGGLVGVLIAITAIVGILAFKLAMLLAPAIWAVMAPFLPFLAAAFAVGLAIATLIEYWDDLKLAFEQVDWGQLGTDILQGILDALIPKKFAEAMANLANAGWTAFKKAIGAESPAKAFIKLGKTIPEGVAVGVDQGAPEAQRAASDMVNPALTTPDLGAPGARGGTLAAAAGGMRIEIGEVHVHASSSDPRQMALDFRRELESVLAGLLTEVGGPVPS